jgi:alpha-glucoside transport system substrate-binding protein
MNHRSMSVMSIAVAAMSVAACVSGSGSVGELAGQTIEVVGVWSGEEQRAFQHVLSVFAKKTGATLKYSSGGDELPIVLRTRVQGGARHPTSRSWLSRP